RSRLCEEIKIRKTEICDFSVINFIFSSSLFHIPSFNFLLHRLQKTHGYKVSLKTYKCYVVRLINFVML
ncbi:hypothetical protein C0J52_21519, partial [Blattella germanica]